MTFASQLIDASLLVQDYQYFPLPFGDGRDGAVTISANTDGGCEGAFGFKQCTTLNIQATFELRAPAGSNNGGIVLAVRDVFTFAGILRADGGNAGATSPTLSGKGGDGAGGAVGGAAISGGTGNIGNGLSGAVTTKVGAGCAGASGAKAYGTSSSFTPGPGRMTTIPSPVLPVFKASGLPFQQFVDVTNTGSGGTNGPDLVLNRGWSKFAMLGGGSTISGNASTSSAESSSCCGGGSGGGGGVIYIAAKHIKFVSGCAISAVGGNGTDAYSPGGFSPAGGGTGGMGGRVVIICDTYEGTPPVPNLIGGLDGRFNLDGVFTPPTAASRGATGVYTFISLRGQIA